MRVAEKLRTREEFTPTENQIAMFILDHGRRVMNMSLEEFAQELYVSKSTIIRFCKKLGFRGHKELCVELAKDQDSLITADRERGASLPVSPDDDAAGISDKIMTMHYRGIADTYREIDLAAAERIASIIAGAEALYIFSAEEYSWAASSFEMKLRAIGFNAFAQTVGTGLLQAAALDERKAALFISYDGKEATLVRNARIISEKNTPLCVLTGPAEGPLVRYGDAVIHVSFHEPVPRLTSIGSAAAITFVLDVLYGLLFVKDFDGNMEKMRRVREYRRNSEPQGR